MEQLFQTILAHGEAVSQSWIREWVLDWKVHPVLVNFTAALIPVSVFCDIAGRLLRKASLHIVGFWTLLFAAVITPFTAIAGWLFWTPHDDGDPSMTIHKWLGTGLAVVLVAMLGWRSSAHARDRSPNWLYLLIGLIIVAALTYQGFLGGEKTFGGGAMEGTEGGEHTHLVLPAGTVS